MIWPLFGRSRRLDTISTLYGMIVAQARSPSFYRDYGVADTVNGRFELIVLHLAVVLRRLETVPATRDAGQSLFDRFCRDMDHNLREMGVGDMAVPKEMRRIGDAFYGRLKAYGSALESGDSGALTAVIARKVDGVAADSPDAAGRLAAYISEAVRNLSTQDAVAIATGEVAFPEPARSAGTI